MRRLLLPLFAASVLSSMAQAEEYPAAGKRDPRMRHIAYSDSQVVHLSTAVGATLVVGFSPKETVTAGRGHRQQRFEGNAERQFPLLQIPNRIAGPARHCSHLR